MWILFYQYLSIYVLTIAMQAILPDVADKLKALQIFIFFKKWKLVLCRLFFFFLKLKIIMPPPPPQKNNVIKECKFHTAFKNVRNKCLVFISCFFHSSLKKKILFLRTILLRSTKVQQANSDNRNPLKSNLIYRILNTSPHFSLLIILKTPLRQGQDSTTNFVVNYRYSGSTI